MSADFRSDTVTRPTAAMKQAMMDAPLGDDVLGDDPTVQALEALAAQLSGKEAALFTPSGTMANQIAVALAARPGDAVLLADNAHIFHHETGGAAGNSGAEIRLVPTTSGLMTPESVQAAIPTEDVHHPDAVLLAVEDTSNAGGGLVHPLERLDALAATAHGHGMRTHLDGARVFNAVVASDIPLARRVAGYDTVSFCLSKGLGAPVGSLLCGRTEDIRRARRLRKRLGGGMRQAGILAAAGLHALEHHVQRLSEDHHRADQLAQGFRDLGLHAPPPQTNLVYVDVPDAPAVQEHLSTAGVHAFAVSDARMRFCTHLDIQDVDVQCALTAMKAAIG